MAAYLLGCLIHAKACMSYGNPMIFKMVLGCNSKLWFWKRARLWNIMYPSASSACSYFQSSSVQTCGKSVECASKRWLGVFKSPTESARTLGKKLGPECVRWLGSLCSPWNRTCLCKTNQWCATAHEKMCNPGTMCASWRILTCHCNGLFVVFFWSFPMCAEWYHCHLRGAGVVLCLSSACHPQKRWQLLGFCVCALLSTSTINLH